MNTSIYNAIQPETFGAGQSVVDVTNNFDTEQWHETGDGLSSGYKHMTCLEDATTDGPWDSRYEGSGHLLGLYRDPENCYWECRLNEAEQSYKLHYIGKRKEVLALVA
jgi:hypothetical protein